MALDNVLTGSINILPMEKVYMSGKIAEEIPYGFMRHEKYIEVEWRKVMSKKAIRRNFH